jgi:RNA polymerase sigma factor (TIGR02999 family)
MSGVTQILASIEQGDPRAAEQLLPLVYEELRRLAAARMLRECRDHTLSATALVHEAYLRLVDVDRAQTWNSRGHFFAAAAEAMRRILVENARQKSRGRNGDGRRREPLRDIPASNCLDADTVLVIDEAIARLAETEPDAANIVKLHIFGGLTLEETADSLDVSRATVYRHWAYARAMLRLALRDEDGRPAG